MVSLNQPIHQPIGDFHLAPGCIVGKNLCIEFGIGRAEEHSISHAAQQGWRHHDIGIKVGRDHQHLPERYFQLLAGSQGQVIYFVFQGNDPSIQKLVRFHGLTPAIIQQERAAVGLQVQRRLMVTEPGIITEIQVFESEFAADHNERAFDAHPALNHCLPQMLEHGLCVTVNSDDPAFFGGYLGENLRVVARAFDLDAEALRQLSRNAIEASFASKERKRELHDGIDRSPRRD